MHAVSAVSALSALLTVATMIAVIAVVSGAAVIGVIAGLMIAVMLLGLNKYLSMGKEEKRVEEEVNRVNSTEGMTNEMRREIS